MRIIAILILSIYLLMGDTIDGLIGYAMKHSTAISQSKLEMDNARLKRMQSGVAKYGELDIVGSYTHYNIERTLAPLPPSVMKSPAPITTSKDIFSVGLSYSVPLFTGFAQTRQVEISDIAKQMQSAKYRLTKDQVIYNIRSLSLTILATREILHAQRDYTNALAKLYRKIFTEVELGKKAKIDRLKAKADLLTSQSQQQQLLSAIEITKASLSSIVGREVGYITPIRVRPKKRRYSIAKLYNIAKRGDRIKVATLSVEKANKMIAKSQASKLPQVALNSYIGKNMGANITTDKWDDETLWQVGVNVKYNLLDFGKRDMDIEMARVAKMQARVAKLDSLRETKKLIKQAVERIKQNYMIYRNSLATLKLTKESEKIERVRYDNDAATLDELLLAKSKRELAFAKSIESRYNHQKSRYYLEYIVHGSIK